MKKTLILLAALALLATLASAQTEDEQNIDLRFLGLAPNQVQSAVYFGIYAADLTADKIDELGYDSTDGIILTDVIEDSPAWEAGLRADDIIQAIDDEWIGNRADFDDIRSRLEPGDWVTITFWRDGDVEQIDMEMQPRPDVNIEKKVIIQDDKQPAKRKLSVGYGGGSWIPVWMNADVSDINQLIQNFGYGADAIKENGVILNGGAGKGNVGNGFFIGGVGAGYTWDRKRAADNSKITYDLSFGGATLDKRFALAKNFVASVGVMVGAGTHEVKYTKYSDPYDWNDPTAANNQYIKASREFFVVQPRAELLYELLGWLGIRAEVGYMYGYSGHSGWQVKGENGDDYHVDNSPDTPFQGLTISVGPWFGF